MSADLHQSAAQVCAVHGISRRMYFNALKVRREGCDELNRAVLDGRVTMNLALSLVEFGVEAQRLILAEFTTLLSREWTPFVRRVRAMSDAAERGTAC